MEEIQIEDYQQSQQLQQYVQLSQRTTRKRKINEISGGLTTSQYGDTYKIRYLNEKPENNSENYLLTTSFSYLSETDLRNFFDSVEPWFTGDVIYVCIFYNLNQLNYFIYFNQ
jgi:hypothetical protein